MCDGCGRAIGLSLSRAKGPTSCAFSFGEAGFVHMGAVVDDQGTWEDVADYLASAAYRRMRREERAAYPLLAWMANRAIEGIRRSVSAVATAADAAPPTA